MTDRSLLIVRGGRNEPDPTFSCIAHSTNMGEYVAIELENGIVTNRTLYRGSERKTLESLAENPMYTSVYADKRTEHHLLPFRYPKHSLTADLNVFRRAKSDEEISAIQRMAGILHASRQHARDEQHFRGTVDSMDYRHALQERTGNEFTLKRYGLQDELGRSVELSSVEPHTLDWKTRMMRVDAGCRAVGKQLKEGVTGAELDKTFRSHLNPISDVIYGSVLHHTGYQPWEDDLKVDVLRKYDVLTVCPIVGDKRGNSVPYMHSVHAITEQEFRGAGASYETLFRSTVQSDDINIRGPVTPDNADIHQRFTKNVEKVMKLWRDDSENSMEVESGSLIKMLDENGGCNEFIMDLSKVFLMNSYYYYASIVLINLPLMLQSKEWAEAVRDVYGKKLSHDFLNFMQNLLYRLIQTSFAVRENVNINLDDDEKTRIAFAIGFVATLIVDDRVRFKHAKFALDSVKRHYEPNVKNPVLNVSEIGVMWYIPLHGAWSDLTNENTLLAYTLSMPPLVEPKFRDLLWHPLPLHWNMAIERGGDVSEPGEPMSEPGVSAAGEESGEDEERTVTEDSMFMQPKMHVPFIQPKVYEPLFPLVSFAKLPQGLR